MIIRSVGIQIQLRNLKTIKASKMIKISSAIFKTFFLSLCIVANIHFAFAQTASILPQGYTQYLDSNGKPLSAGKVYNYIPSTTTPKTTWQDAAETIPNANPVILDAAGRAKILGDGSYRQIVKDRNNVTIWDAVTSSTGSGSTSPTATGDGDLVGTIKPWAGMTAPNQYAFAYGQEVSRTTYSALYTAITSSQSVFCNSGSPILNGLSDTTNFWIGMSVEVSCVAAGFSTIVSKTASTVVLADNANVTTNPTAIFYPWGRGNGTTTFNLPDLRGVVPAGNNNMGGVASANLTTTYFGSTDPNSIGALGGNQSKTLIAVNIPGHSHPVFLNDPGHTHVIFNPGSFGGNATGAAGLAGLNTGIGSTSTLSSTTGTTIRDTSGGFGTANQTNYTGGGIAVSATLGNTGSGYTNGAQTITITGGTCTTQPQFTVTVAGNIFTGTPALLTAGSCTVAPTNPAATSGGGGTGGTLNVTYSAQPFSLIPPTRTTNFIIKITPDSNSATASGVTSLGGMTGDIACGSGLLCTGNNISSTVVAKTNPGNFYVSSTGNDSNNCLIGNPCLTLQRVVNLIYASYDLNGTNTIINIGAGSFAGAQINNVPPNSGNGGRIVIKGAGSTNTTLTSSLVATNYADILIGSMKITVASGSNIIVENNSNVQLYDGDINLGSASVALIQAISNSAFYGSSGYNLTISGGATYGFLATLNSNITLSTNATLLITGTPNFSSFVTAIDNSSFDPGFNSIISGSATGLRFALSVNSAIDMENITSQLPGDTPGTMILGSNYYTPVSYSSNNTFSGFRAGQLLIDGATATTGVTAIGAHSLTSNSSASNSTAVGYNALNVATGLNDAFGANSGSYITSSVQNVGVGYGTIGGGSSTALTGSGNNTAVGYAALTNIRSTSNTNTAIGSSALASLTTASSNTAVGYAAGYNTTGGNNTFFGTDAGQYVTTGTNNTAIGNYSLQGSSGGGVITGSYNVGVGVLSSLNSPSDTNSISVGYNITGLGSNSINIGNIFGATGINTPSTSAATIPNKLTIGTQQTTQGSLVLSNTAAGAYDLTLKSSNSATAAWTYTYPTAAPTIANSVAIVSTGGVASWAAPGKIPGTPYVIKSYGAANSITGVTVETTAATIAIPANSIGPNGSITIHSIVSATNNANAKVFRVRYGGTSFVAISMASQASLNNEIKIYNRNATNSQIAPASITTSYGVTTAANITGAIDTTTNQDITITLAPTNAADTMTLEAYTVEIRYSD